MSWILLDLARRFSKRTISADDFAEDYIVLWKREGEAGLLVTYPDNVSEALSTIFCLADIYNPGADREEYELDEETLRQKVADVLAGLSDHEMA